MLINSVKNTVNNQAHRFGDLIMFLLSVPMRTDKQHTQSLGLLVGALLFMALLFSGCATNPVTGNQDFVTVSNDKELQIGRENHPKIIAQYGLYQDEAMQKYVQSVGEKLAEASHRPDLIYRFTVLDSPVINAFALPGGYIYITRGLMAYLNSEAELAAVLGHEIGHVTARHGVRQQSASTAANLLYTLGAILVPELRHSASQEAFNMLGGALLSGYGREHELEADRLGAEYLARTGYTPAAMIDVIRVLKDQEQFAAAQAKKLGQEYQGYHGLFASHPDNDTRLHEVVAAANQYQISDKSKVGKQVYLKHLEGLTFGDSEKQGIRSGRNFYHLSMRFALSFPEGWHIENGQKRVQAIAAEGKAFIEMGVSDVNKKLTPAQFIAQRLDLKIRSGEAFNNHGLEGYTGLTEIDKKAVRVGVVYLRKQAFIFLGGTKNGRDMDLYDEQFVAAIKSFHDLKQEEEHLAHELTLHLVTAAEKDSYASWAKASRISNSPEQQLRLLNGDFPNGEVKSGQQYKLVH